MEKLLEKVRNIPSYTSIGFILFLILLLLLQFSFVERVTRYIELPFYDFASKLRKKPLLHSDIAVVAITDGTTNAIGDNFPWSDLETYYEFMLGIKLLKPKLLVWDIEFQPRFEKDGEFRKFANVYGQVNSISAISLAMEKNSGECETKEYQKLYKFLSEGKISNIVQSQFQNLYACLHSFVKETLKPCFTDNFVKYLKCVSNGKLNAQEVFSKFKELYLSYTLFFNLSLIEDYSKRLVIKSDFPVKNFNVVNTLSQITLKKSKQVGYANVESKEYGKIRSIPVTFQLNNTNLSHLSIVSFAIYKGFQTIKVEEDKVIFGSQNGGEEIPIENGEFLVTFLEPIDFSQEEQLKRYNIVDAGYLIFLGRSYDSILSLLKDNFEVLQTLENSLLGSKVLERILKVKNSPGKFYLLCSRFIKNLKSALTKYYSMGIPEEEKENYEALLKLFESIEEKLSKYKEYVTKLYNRLNNKVVFIGGIKRGADLKSVTIASNYPGVFIPISAFNSLLTKSYFTKFSSALLYFITFIILLLLFYILNKYGSIMSGIILTIIFALTFGIKVKALEKNIYVDYSIPLILLFLPIGASIAIKERVEGATKKMLKETFQNYISKEVLDYLLADPSKIKLGGEMKEATIFFSDLQGFTTFSEKYRPVYVISVLNEYLKIITDAILSYRGFLDKYEGDGVMAAFGIPIEFPESAEYACKAACAIKNSLKNMAKEWESRGFPLLSIRIGLATGTIIAGNIGSEKRADYTLIGDFVNLANRLEQANKFFKTTIIIEENTYKKIAGKFYTRKIGTVKVKGKEIFVNIYELVDEISNPNIDVSFLNLFNKAMELFYQREFEEAKYIFEKLYSLNNADVPAKKYIELCNELLRKESITDGDLVIKLG